MRNSSVFTLITIFVLVSCSAQSKVEENEERQCQAHFKPSSYPKNLDFISFNIYDTRIVSVYPRRMHDGEIQHFANIFELDDFWRVSEKCILIKNSVATNFSELEIPFDTPKNFTDVVIVNSDIQSLDGIENYSFRDVMIVNAPISFEQLLSTKKIPALALTVVGTSITREDVADLENSHPLIN